MYFFLLILQRYVSERRHGSTTRVPGHTFLAWLSSWRMVVYIYYIKVAVNSSSGSWAAHVRATGTVYMEKTGGVRPAYHVQNHTCRITLLKPARRATLLDQPSSLRPHWYVCMLLPWCILQQLFALYPLMIGGCTERITGRECILPTFSPRQLGQSVSHQRQSSVKNFIYIFF